jgi:hypothetical protein
MRIQMPPSLRIGHDELHRSLAALAGEAGTLGDEVRRVARLLEPHARKEEAFVLPALGLIARLARGEIHPEMAQVFPHTDWLKNNLATLLAEHSMILGAAEKMLDAARAERRSDCVELAERLINHLRGEEEVLYPAAILVGQYLRLSLAAEVRDPLIL